MASCCVSREVWIHSLLAAVGAACSACIPLLVAPGCTALGSLPFAGNSCERTSVRLCASAPLHLCTLCTFARARESRQVCKF